MMLANFGNFFGGVAVARSDFAQIFARHAIESVDGCAMIARGREQFVEWGPVVSPIKFEANTLAQFVFFNFAVVPLVQDVLVARENCFDSQRDGALVEFVVAEKRGYIALRVGQG